MRESETCSFAPDEAKTKNLRREPRSRYLYCYEVEEVNYVICKQSGIEEAEHNCVRVEFKNKSKNKRIKEIPNRTYKAPLNLLVRAWMGEAKREAPRARIEKFK